MRNMVCPGAAMRTMVCPGAAMRDMEELEAFHRMSLGGGGQVGFRTPVEKAQVMWITTMISWLGLSQIARHNPSRQDSQSSYDGRLIV